MRLPCCRKGIYQFTFLDDMWTIYFTYRPEVEKIISYIWPLFGKTKRLRPHQKISLWTVRILYRPNTVQQGLVAFHFIIRPAHLSNDLFIRHSVLRIHS